LLDFSVKPRRVSKNERTHRQADAPPGCLPVFPPADFGLESDIFNTAEALPTRSESSTNMQHQLSDLRAFLNRAAKAPPVVVPWAKKNDGVNA
jgi:hypothetical protein